MTWLLSLCAMEILVVLHGPKTRLPFLAHKSRAMCVELRSGPDACLEMYQTLSVGPSSTQAFVCCHVDSACVGDHHEECSHFIWETFEGSEAQTGTHCHEVSASPAQG